MQRDRLLSQTILVVDDDRELAALVGEFLEREGYAVRIAHTGEAARRLLRESPIALVVLDLVLPDLDALELMKEALRLDEPAEIVIVTGHASVDSAVAAVEASAAGYLVKPFHLPRLATLVGRALERQGLARENLRLSTELSDRLAEAESLLAVSSTVASTLDLQEALRRICRELVRLTGGETAAAYVQDPGGRLLVPTAGYRVPKELLPILGVTPIPLEEQGFHLLVWTTRRPLWSDDVASDARFSHELFRSFHHQSGLLLPLLLDGEVAGAFYVVWWRMRRTFTERELAVLEQVSGQVSLLLRNARLFEQAARDRHRLETLHDVARRLAAVHVTDEILSLIVNEATRLLGVEAAGIRLVEGSDLVVAARTESAAPIMARARIKTGESLTGIVVATGEPLVVEDVTVDTRFDPTHRRRAAELGYQGFVGVPLRAHGRIIGALNVYARGRRQFSPDEVSLLSAFADQASLAIEKARLLRQAQEGREVLEQLYRVTIQMQTSWDRADRLQEFVRGAHEVVGFDRVQVLLASADGSAFEAVAAHGMETMPVARLPLSPAAGFFYQAFQTRRPVAVGFDDALGTLRLVDPSEEAFETSRFLIAPLAVGDRAIGVAVGENEPGGRLLSAARVEPFLLLCQQLAMALEETRLYAETRAREHEATKLYEVTRQLASTLDLDHVLDLITARTLDLLGSDAAGIYVYDEAKGGLTFLRGLNLDPALTAQLVLTPGEGVAGRAFQERRAVFTRDRLADATLRYAPKADELIRTRAPRAYLAVPIISRGEVYGVLVDYFFAPHDFTAAEIQLLSALADHAAIAVENARLYAETRAREQEAQRLSTGLGLLNQASRALYRTLEVDTMLRGALVELARAFGADSALVNLISDDGRLEKSVGHWLSEEHGREVAVRGRGGITQLVRETRQPLILRDVAERRDVVHPAHFAFGIRSLAALPIEGRAGRVLGVLFLYYRVSQDFPESDLRLLGAYADQLATALENAQLYEEAQTQRTRLRQILDSTSDGILLVNPDGRIEAANRRARELFGAEAAGATDASLAGLLADRLRDAEPVLSLMRALLVDPDRGGKGEFELIQPVRRIVEWVGQPTRNAVGATVGLTLTFRDVTEEREISQMKADFVSFATHQLRTPLAGIKWMLELATDGADLPADARSYLQDARQANERLITLVNDLLNASRLESGRLQIVPEDVDLAALTRSVLDDLAGLVRERGHRLGLDAAATLPRVRVDPQLFRQVVVNLISNAIKYTLPGGEIAIGITSDDGSVHWAIRDSGIGIPKEVQHRLFEKFYRAENVLAVETEGTGLGLYLVRLIVEQSGGRIWCESEEGKGSTFVFTAPAAGPGS